MNRNSQFSSWFPLIYREFMIPALRIRIRPQYCNVLLYWIVARFDENSRIDVHITVQCKFQSTWKSFISGPFFFNISMWSLGLPFFLFYYDISQLVIVSIGYLMSPLPPRLVISAMLRKKMSLELSLQLFSNQYFRIISRYRGIFRFGFNSRLRFTNFAVKIDPVDVLILSSMWTMLS